MASGTAAPLSFTDRLLGSYQTAALYAGIDYLTAIINSMFAPGGGLLGMYIQGYGFAAKSLVAPGTSFSGAWESMGYRTDAKPSTGMST